MGFLTYTREPASRQDGFAPIVVTAALSVVVLLAVAGWEIQKNLQEKQEVSSFIAIRGENDPIDLENTSDSGGSGASFSTSTDVISYIGPAVLDHLVGAYLQMQEDGTYTASGGEKVAENLASVVRAPVEYRAYQGSDLKTDSDTSYQRMLAYRSDLRDALAPLLKNTQPEYEIFALYASTKDSVYLAALRTVAQNYRDAQSAVARVIVPKDATPYHLGILNAMGEFAATLDAMARHADDPFAAVALLRTYNEGEVDILTSFNALTTYYKSKTP